ncbi:MAG: phage virion morphogenesis protein [Deltaproteobacteria bacterium]|nr:phage virion morphogenesis protein [Deltaproteobacteria bacterium]
MSLRFQTSGLDEAIAHVRRLGGIVDELGEPLAVVLERQTKRRVDVEKTTPEGSGWPAWTGRYAASGQAREPLERSGDLIDSIHAEVSGDAFEVGSDLPYAARQERRRRWLGIGRDDEREFLAVVDQVAERLAGAAA